VKHPTSPRNRRVTIILLRESYLKTMDENTPAQPGMLTVPKPTDNINNPQKAVAKPVAPKK